MENEQGKLIAEQIKTLPKELQGAIQSVPWKNLVQEIGSANGLNADQMVSFDQETMLMIYGFESPTNYISNLIKEVGVTKELANILADSVAEKILTPIDEKASSTTPSVPEVAPEIHPMIEPGETVHDVKPTTNDPQPTIEPQQTPSSPSSLPPPVTPPQVENPSTPTPATAPVTPPTPKPTKIEEKKSSSPIANTNYPDGKDPYREPIS